MREKICKERGIKKDVFVCENDNIYIHMCVKSLNLSMKLKRNSYYPYAFLHSV